MMQWTALSLVGATVVEEAESGKGRAAAKSRDAGGEP
jgi:hypothetical protein